MNRNKLLRKTALTRRKPMRQKRSKPRRSGRVRDAGYLACVRGLPCVLRPHAGTACYGQVHAHHAGRRPVGRKADDSTAIPLCSTHHQQLHDRSGYFNRGDAAWLRDIQDLWVGFTRERLGWKGAA